jgi:hypothetical protein
MSLPEYVGNSVRPMELQVNQNYALVFRLIPDEPEISTLCFHSMKETPSQRVMAADVTTAAKTSTRLVLAEMLYWDADIWQIRSLINDTVLTIARKDCELISDKPLN